MKWYISVVCLVHWGLSLGEYWTAKVRTGVRCKDVFQNSTTSSHLHCFINCLKTSRCCSVNYVEEQNLCEFCTAGPMVRLTKDDDKKYIGFTFHQEKQEDAEHLNKTPCYACAESFNNVPFTVNTTDDGDVKIFKCSENSEAETGVTEATCKYKNNQWSSTKLNCQEKTLCFNTKEDFNEPISTLTNGRKCLRWDHPNVATRDFSDRYFTADGKSKASAQNYCRHPAFEESYGFFSYPYLYCNYRDDFFYYFGMCAVRSCDSTNLDQCGTPPSLPSPAVRSYPVVGDVYLANYKCASLSGDNPTPHCPVSRCIGDGNWTTPSVSCSTKDCFTPGQSKIYKGKRSCTESGRICLAWRIAYDTIYAKDPDNGNYCRGLKDMRPGCYTTDPKVLWENCNIPEC